MALITVDQDQCNRDGICVDVCPAKVIEIKGEGAFPSLVQNGELGCIRCGHCVAVCPKGAMSHQKMAAADCPSVQKELLLSPEQMEQFLRYRRSIRVYKDRGVEKAKITRLIDIARHAPSARNLQPVHWHVIYNRDDVQKLSGLVVDWMRHLIKEKSPLATAMHLDLLVSAWDSGKDRICRDAPHLVVAHAPKDDRTAPVACTIALAYFELAAVPLGLGACWAGYFNTAANLWPPLQAALSLPDGHISYGAMMVGYSKYSYRRLPFRNDPKVTWR